MLAVSPDHQGSGAGTALTEWCVDRAVDVGRTRIILHTTQWMTTAHRIYERAGFERTTALDWEPFPGFLLMAFVKELSVKAVVLESYGEPEVLKVEDIPEPTPGPDEVIVEVAASALNRADLLQRRGGYPGPKLVYGGRTFDIPGMELSGRIVERGSRVTEFAIDEAVMAIVSGGAYAERCAVHERQLLSVPFTVPTRDAAAIPEVFITALGCARRPGRAHVGPHRARARRRVWRRHRRDPDRQGHRRARASSRRRRARSRRAEALGADHGVDYRAKTSSRRRSSSPAGEASMSSSTSSAATTSSATSTRSPRRARSCRSVRWGAARRTFNLGKMLPKRARLIGTVLRARPLEEKAAISRRFGREVVPLFDQGPARSRSSTGTSHSKRSSRPTATWRANANVGKIVLDVT